MQRLGQEYMEQIYDLMEKSFPLDEYRTYEEQKSLFSRKEYNVYGLVNRSHSGEKGGLQAFIALWEFEEFSFIEHFAVHPACRNTGMGAEILQKVLPGLSDPVCLEVELPQNELAVRRIGFYQRNGFRLNDYPYQQPSISKGRNPIPLSIMTWERSITEEQFRTIRDRLYRAVYGV